MKNLLLATAMWAALMGSSAVAHAEEMPDHSFAEANPTGSYGRTTEGVIVKKACLVFEDDSFMCGYFKDTSTDGWQIDVNMAYVTGCIPNGFCQDEDIDFGI